MDGALSASFFSTSTYENATEAEAFPTTLEPIWILGSKYSLLYDREDLEDDIRSRLRFTYRKCFSAIGGSGPTSDFGWGCMLRCGQMMLAQALINRHLSREWRWKPAAPDLDYLNIVKLFVDKKDSCYSIHQIASMGVSEGKAVGEWFGPNTVAQVLRKLAIYDHWSGLVIHIAMDNCVITDDIRELCLPKESLTSTKTKPSHSAPTHCDSDSANACPQCTWRPLLLFIPMRLGLSDINPIYFNAVKSCFTFKQSVGIIGGKPNNAYWFIGCTENKLFYLDPHRVQPFVDLTNGSEESDESFHCNYPCYMDLSQLDPSIAMGFYCGSVEEFEDLCRGMRRLSVLGSKSTPLFEVHSKRPSHLPPVQAYNPTAAATDTDFTLLDEQRIMDSEDEFEIIM